MMGWMDRPIYYASSIRDLLAAVDDGLPEGLRHTLVCLCLWADASRVAWVGQSVLAQRMRVHPDTVKERLKALRQRGLLGATVSRRTAEGSRVYGYPILVPEAVAQDPSWLDAVLLRPTPSA